MGKWTIYDKDGNPRHWYQAELDDEGNIVRQDTLELHDEWMAECFLTVSIRNAEPIDFAVGDYIDYRDEHYVIDYEPTVLKKARKGSYGEGFTYDNIKFVHEAQAKTVRCDFTDIVLGPDNKIHYTSLPTFPFYCATVDDLLDRIQANLEELFPGEFIIIGLDKTRALQRGRLVGREQDFGDEYDKYIGEADPDYGSKGVALTVDNITCWDAMTKVHSDFGLNFIQRGYTYIVGTAGFFTSKTFEYGLGKGLYEIEKIGDPSQKIITLLRSYGSEDNIPTNYYANLHKRATCVITGKRDEPSQVQGDTSHYRHLVTSLLWNNVKNAFTKKVKDADYTARVTLTYGAYTAEVDAVGIWAEDTQTMMLQFYFGNATTYLDFFNAVSENSEIIISEGVEVSKWPSNLVKQDPAYTYPASLVMNRLMLPGFPDQSLYDWALEHGWSVVDSTKGEVSKDGITVRLSKDPFRPYIESLNSDVLGIRPGSIYFDGTNDNPDIKPTITGMGVDTISSAEQINDSGVYTEGEVPNFTITLPDLGFDLSEYYESGASIDLTDGMCGGRSFEMAERPDQNADGTWTCKCSRCEDATLHLWFPYCDFQIKSGDHYVLTGIRLPKAYVDNASERLFDASIDALFKNHAPRLTYQPRIDELWMQRQDDTAHDTETKSLHDTLKAGDIFKFKDVDLNIDAGIIIDVLTIKENGNNGIPTYEVTLREEKEVSSIQKLQNKVDSLSSGGNGYGGGSGGGGGITARQAESLIPSEGSEYFLSKIENDEAQGLITFLKGIKIGLSKLFGWSADGNVTANNISAADITASGRINAGDGVRTDEVRSTNYTGDGIADTGFLMSNNISGRSKLIIDEIYVRIKAVFEALEVKKWSVTAGDEIRSCASNTINVVDYYDGNGNLLGYSYTRVPWHLHGIYFLLSHFSKGLGRKMYSTLKKVRMTLTQEQLEQVRTCRCYFLAKDGEKEVDNWWKSDSEYGHDYARCQTMNLVNTNRETFTPIKRKIGNVFWWRKVTGVSTNPVELEQGKSYHYFDVAYNYLEEQQQGQTTYAAAGSDIPCAGDDVVQFGNDINPGRMNLIISQINGGGRFDYDTSDAPCIKMYKGIYTFDLSKCWFGGNPCKAKMSPSTGYEFFGPEFKFTQEYGSKHVEIQRGAWTDIEFEADDYSRTYPDYSDDIKNPSTGAFVSRADGSPKNYVRKCYYYDNTSHTGCQWLCSIVEGAHWVNQNGQYITDSAYAALSDADKVKCTRKQNYTVQEPKVGATDWTLLVEKGDSVVQIFKWLEDGQTPSTPAKGDGTIPPSGWSKSAPNRPSSGEYNLWMSQGTEGVDGKLEGSWSTPVRISGNKGTAGEDASDTEWIYVCVSQVGGWTNPNVLKDKDGVDRTAEYIATHDDFVPYKWTDNPAGISKNNPYEYACFRFKPKGKNQTWGQFSEPIMWSHWGRNGTDGDGVEYVYIRTSKEVAPEVDHTQSGYDVDEYLPAIINQSECGAEANRCTDDNKGVNSTYRYEWAIIRRMTAPDATTGVRSWTKFLGANNDYKMSLWERYALDGAPGGNTATLYLYKRSATPITAIDWSATLTYTFATKSLNTVPTGWSLNTIPSGTDPIYVTAATAYSNAATDTIAANEWATPVEFVENGAHGINTASVFLYQRAASAPAKPSAALTYTFATGALSGTLGNWSQTIPATNGQPCWVTQATAISQGDTDTINASEWSTVRKYVEDGKSITKISETYRYATNNTGVRPAATSTDWSTTKPTLNKGYWLYTETTITWSDESKTVLYTDERNPNDGVAGQDIVNGTTTITYCQTDTPVQPADSQFGPYPSSLTKGKWLWSKATTPYYKANDLQHPIGYSSNYNVSYIATDGTNGKDGKDGTNGTNGRGITAIAEYYKASNKATGETAPSDDSGWTTNPNTAMASWNETNKYLWNYEKVTYSSGTTVERTTPTVIAIWTKDGAAGKGIDSIVNKYKVTSTNTAPARAHEGGTGWDDNPMAPTADNPYLWNYEIITWVNPAGTTYTSVQMIGHFGKDGAQGPQGLSVSTINKFFKASSSNSAPSWDANTWTQDAVPSDWNATNKYLWCREKTTMSDNSTVKWSNIYLHSVWGEKGAGGDAAVGVIVSPETILVTQATTSPYSIDLTNAYTDVSVNKGGVPDTNFTITNVTGVNCTAALQSGTKRIKISAISQSGGQYYDNGYVTFKVNYGGKSYDMRFNFYANLLGTWKQQVENGEETIAANKIIYTFGAGGSTVDAIKTDYTSKRNSIGDWETWSSQSNTSQGSKRYINEHLATAETNISSLSSSVNGIETSVSKIEQTADAISLGVQNGWKNYVENPVATDGTLGVYTSASIVEDAVFGQVRQITYGSSSNWQLRHNAVTAYEELTGEPVTWFCVVKCTGNGSLDFGSGSNETKGNLHAIRMTGYYQTVAAVESKLSTSYYDILDSGHSALGNNWYLCWVSAKPKSSATGIIDGSSSRNSSVGFNCMNGTWQIYYCGIVMGAGCPSIDMIKQGAGLKRAGIDITNGVIKLQGDKVTFTNTSGTVSDKVRIDPTKGTIIADGGEFENIEVNNATIKGSLMFHKVVTEYSQNYLAIANASSTIHTSLKADIFVIGRNFSTFQISFPPAYLFRGAQVKIAVTQNITYEMNITRLSGEQSEQSDSQGEVYNGFINIFDSRINWGVRSLTFQSSMYKVLEFVSVQSPVHTSYDVWMLVDAK